MLVLKCKCCGFQQGVNNKIDKDIYEQLINNEELYSDRNICNGRNIKRPKGYIAVYGVFGGWTVIRQATLDEYKAIKRAQELRDLGMKDL